MAKRILLVIVGVFFFLTLGLVAPQHGARAAGPYFVVSLPANLHLGGGHVINSNRQIVLNSANSLYDSAKAYVWQDGTLTELVDTFGTVSAAGGAAINESGVVTGAALGEHQRARIFRWENGTMTNLEYVPLPNTEGVEEGYGYGINASGAIAGVSGALIYPCGFPSDPAPQDCAMSVGTLANGGAPTQLDSLTSCNNFCEGAATDINDAGVLVGYDTITNGVHGCCYIAVRWDGTAVTPLEQDHTVRSYASAINNHNQIVGYRELTTYGATHAILWDNGTKTDLFANYPDITSGVASDINDTGQIVGNGYNNTTGSFAFLYENGTLVDLNTLISSSSGWNLATAQSINENGDVVGMGYYGGSNTLTPYLLTVPDYIVNTTADDPDADPNDGKCLTSAGECSLRAALESSNGTTKLDIIAFDIPGSGVPTIQPATDLPVITHPVVLDATTQPTVSKVALDGTNVPGTLFTFPNALTIQGGHSTIKGLVISHFSGIAIDIEGSGNNTIQGNFIGTDPTGMTVNDQGTGIFINNSSDNVVGGKTTAERNLVAVGGIDTHGSSSQNNVIQGNYLDVNANGIIFPDGRNGITIYGDNNTIGGTEQGQGNVSPYGLDLFGDHNTVQGNYIGTDATGAATAPNSGTAISLIGASDNLIGGYDSSARNIIVGQNEYGILARAVNGKKTDNNQIIGNYIGLDPTGTVALGTGYSGIHFQSGTGNQILNNTIVKSGTNPDDDPDLNTFRAGITFEVGTSGNTIQSNYIGTDQYGTANFGGTDDGIYFDDSDNNTIKDNVIAGNQGTGIDLSYGADHNTVEHNGLGTDLNGNWNLGNGGFGVQIYISNYNIIGAPYLGNQIVASTGAGIRIENNGSTNNTIQGNTIRGTLPAPSYVYDGDGIHVVGGVDNEIGGTSYGQGNTITGNQGAGVAEEYSSYTGERGSQNPILGNAIHDNGGLGIRYYGVSPVGTSYAVPVITAWETTVNNGGGGGGGTDRIQKQAQALKAHNARTQKHAAKSSKTQKQGKHKKAKKSKRVTLVVPTGNGTTAIHGTLDAQANTSYRIEFFVNNTCDPSGGGEGDTLLGFENVTTQADGHIALDATMNVSIPEDGYVTATATDANNNTSVFSQCKAALKLVVNDAGDAADANVGDGNCLTAGGVCTLRAAIQEANAQSNPDKITFNIAGGGIPTIQPLSQLPSITAPLTLDGTSQPNSNWVELDGSLAPHGLNDEIDGLEISAGNSTVMGMIVNRFSGFGIHLTTNGNNTITGNRIGTNAQGTDQATNRGAAIWSEGAPNNTIGGTSFDKRNVIAGNVWLRGVNGGSNTVQGNYLGTDATGMTGLLATDIIIVDSQNNTLGGTAAGAGNVISGGIDLSGDNNTVQGNFFGTDANGAHALGDSFGRGIHSDNASNNLIGGNSPAARNVFVNVGIYLKADNLQTVQGNQITGNLIGVNAAGDTALGVRGPGVWFDRTDGGNGLFTNNTIRGNLIAKATGFDVPGFDHLPGDGIRINGPAAQNTLQDNFIGTNSNGATGFGNQENGITLNGATNNTLKGNVISGNGTACPCFLNGVGIELENDANQNTIQGNQIGVTPDGNTALPNGSDGILVSDAAGNQIGGANSTLANIISSNGGTGVHIYDVRATENIVQGNSIGTNPSGSDLGNQGNGVWVEQGVFDTGPANNQIGGTAAGQGNVIAFNGLNGVVLDSPLNPARANTIYANGSLGIDVGGNGVDASGVPTMTTAYTANGTLEISGAMGTSANSTYGVDVYANSACDPSGDGEGEMPLFSGDIQTDANGAFDAAFPAAVSNGAPLTLVITGDSTSEFSECLALSAPSYVSNAPNCNGDTPCYATLTDAIAQAPRGSVIRVNGGTYDENVLVNRQLGLYFTGDVTINGAFDMGHAFIKGTSGNLTVTGDVNAQFAHYLNNGGTFTFNGQNIPPTAREASSLVGFQSNDTGVQTFTGNVTFNNVDIGPNTILNTGTSSFQVQGTLTNQGALQNTPPSQTVNTATLVTFKDGAGNPAIGLASNGAQGLGSTSVTVSSGLAPAACGSQPFPATPIQRQFDLTPSNQTNISATVRLYYAPSEANGVLANNVVIYHCNGTQWQELTGTYTRDTANGLNYVQLANVTAFSPFALGNSGTPTEALVTKFRARAKNASSVQLLWHTSSEISILGFNVWRQAKGKTPVQVNSSVIPAKNPGEIIENNYKFQDAGVTAGYKYSYYVQVLLTTGASLDTDAVKVRIPNLTCTQAPDSVTLLAPTHDAATLHQVTLKWSQALCAVNYEFTLQRDGKPVQTKTVTAVKYALSKLIKGNYQWQVRACNTFGCSSWSDWSKFVVKGKTAKP